MRCPVSSAAGPLPPHRSSGSRFRPGWLEQRLTSLSGTGRRFDAVPVLHDLGRVTLDQVGGEDNTLLLTFFVVNALQQQVSGGLAVLPRRCGHSGQSR